MEANLFAMLTTQFTVPLQPRNDPNLTTTYGKSYKAFFMNEVTGSNFDQHFNALRKGFISNSRGNYNGDYSKFPSGENNESLLKRFFK